MPQRVMFVHLKNNGDAGPCWISTVRFSKTWRTAYWHGHTLRRGGMVDGNFRDVDSGEEYWLSGPKRDRTDARYGNQQPEVDEDVRETYEAFLGGAPLPGRAHG